MDMKRNQAGQTPITRIQRPEFGAYMDLLICISMRLESFRNSCILVVSGIQRSGPSLKQNIWETQWDKVFSFALIQTWQNSMNSSLSSESLIKSTEHALNVTQGKKTNTKQNKIYVLALSKEINTESFQVFFSVTGSWAQSYGYGQKSQQVLYVPKFFSLHVRCNSSFMLSISVTSSPL